MIFQSPSDSINYIHIPRTGGRFVAGLLFSNGYILNGHQGVVDGVEVVHFHAELIEKYLPKSKSFTIVRDPVDRFKSGFTGLLDYAIATGMESKLYSSDITDILTAAQDLSCNWYRPQSEFILPDTQVWKYEKGLNQEFIKWLNRSVGLSVQYTEVNYPLMDFDYKEEYPYTKEMITAVKQFYIDDYQL